MKNLEVSEHAHRNRSNSSLVTRSNRSRSNSFKPQYDEMGRPINQDRPISLNFSNPNLAVTVSKPPEDENLAPSKSSTQHSNLSVSGQEIKPINHNKSHEEPGFLSSILNIAHSTANIITHKDSKEDKRQSFLGSDRRLSQVHDSGSSNHLAADSSEDAKSTFSNKLDSLIHDSGMAVEGDGGDFRASQTPLPDKNGGMATIEKTLSPSNVQFQSVRESPLNTLGEGNLTLNDFKDSRRDSLDRISKLESKGSSDLKSSNDTKQKRKSLVDSELDSEEPHVVGKKLKYASKKRNKEFHQIFKKVPKTDRLIDDFSCALSKDILVQGRMYLSTNFICFKSNILGWVTNLLIPLQEVIQIEKRSTAVLFPNGMIIKTLYQKYTFATFISRDTTFDLLTRVWHRVLLEKDGSTDNIGSGYEEDSEIDDENEDDDGDYEGLGKNSVAPTSSDEDDENDNVFSEDDSDEGPLDEDLNDTTTNSTTPTGEDEDGVVKDVNGQPKENLIPNGIESDGSNNFRGLPTIGPLTHEPTSSGYEKSSNDTFIVEDEFKAPLGVVFSLLFGKDTSYFIRILKEQKNFDIEESKIVGIEKQGDQRDYKYIKPLGGAIGPKQTTCLMTDKVLSFDLDSCILVEQATSTPDVPSGNAFKVRTNIYLYWGNNNTTKIYVVTTIDWTGKSWIKGPIEKGSIEGQKESMKILIETVNEFISSGGKGGKGKRSRKKSVRKSGKAKEETTPIEQESTKETKRTVVAILNDLAQSIGELISIPMVPPLVVGYFTMFIQMLVMIHLYNWIFHSSGDRLKLTGSGNNSVQLKGGKFFLVPSIENSVLDKDLQRANEVKLWDWINDKSDANFQVKNDDYTRDYNHQELEEISRLTKMKLEELDRLLRQARNPISNS